MSKLTIIIVLLILSCEERKPTLFPQLSTDLIEKAYALNNVSSYVELDYFNGDTLALDSVHLNEYGNTLSRTGLVGWDSNSIYDYDSLNRPIKLSHDSDINYEYFITYDFSPTQHRVIEKWFETISNDTVLFTKYIYSFDDEFRKILFKKRLDDEEDYSVTEFKYDNGRIIVNVRRNRVYFSADCLYFCQLLGRS